MSDKILVVDDETEIADLIEVYLKNENYTVFKFYTAQEALNCIETTSIDLAILDIMLPDIDGFTLCKKIREHHTYPIIMLTAKDAETDKITGLTLGADDYMTKPFRPLEMIARVKSQLRRYQKYNPAHSDAGETSYGVPEDNLVCGSLTMNIKAHTCFLGETPLVLTPTEFSILRILLENAGNVVSSEDLFHQIWQDEYYNRLCHNKQLINSHFYRGVSELPYKLLFAVIYTHLEFRYEVSHTITSHHVHHFHQTRIPDGTLLDYMVQYRKPLFPQFFLYPKKFLPENNPHHKEFHLRPYIQNNANQ